MLVRKLLTIADIRPGEGRLVGLVLCYTFCAYATDLLIYTTAYALFLNDFDAQHLPYIYIGISLYTILFTLFYLWLSQRYSLAQMLLGMDCLLLCTIIGYRIGLTRPDSYWIIFNLPIWAGVSSLILFITYWNLVGRLFNLQQGKRIFGLLGAGTQLTGLVVGLLVPGLVTVIGSSNLLVLAALASSGAVWILRILIKQAPVLQTLEEPESAPAEDDQAAPASLLRDPYVQLIFALFTFFAFGTYFIDNIFYNRVESQFPNEEQLAGFLGLFNGVNSGLSLIIQLFLANRLLNRYGVRAAVLLTPLLLSVGTLIFILTGSTFGMTPMLFWLAAVLNLIVLVMNDTDNTAANLLYQPLPAGLRTRLQTMADGIFSPVAMGVAGVILLVLTQGFHFTPLQLAYMLLPILIGWTLTGIALGRGYGRRVQQALRQRLIQGNRGFTPDRASLAHIQQNLANPHPGAALYALDVLATADSAALAQALPRLLEHPSAAVRLEALSRLERMGDAATLPAIQRCFATDADPTVRGTALRAMAALGGLTHIDDLESYLHKADPYLRQSVLVGLLRSGDLEAILAVGETLAQLVNSSMASDRLMAARVLGESGVTSFYRPLLKLLHDPEPLVQRAALSASGKLQQPKLWPQVIEALATPKTRTAAYSALVAGGETALPFVQGALVTASQTAPAPSPLERRLCFELVRVCGRVRSAKAIDSLLPLLTYPDLQVRTQVLHALQQCGYQATVATRPLIEEQIAAELAHTAWILAGLVDLAEDVSAANSLGLVRSALLTSLAQQRSRLFLWLALIYDAPALARVRELWGGGQSSYRQISEEQRAYAMETLDLVVAKTITKHLLPLLDDLSPAQQYERLAGDFPQPALACQPRLLAIITSSAAWVSPWLRAVALYSAATLTAAAEERDALYHVAASACTTAEPLLCETVAWAQSHLDMTSTPNNMEKTVQQGGAGMLLTIEKVMILKTVDIFADTPDEILVEIAMLLKEVNVPAGVVIFEKGAPGDSMYLIVEGEAEAYDGEHVFTRMYAREVFGEMALLDGEPRTASIRTTQPTNLLRLDQEPFYELMDDRIEIARGIIHVLLQRLRLRTNDVHRLQAQLEALAITK